MEERRMEEVYGKVVLARGISSRDLAYNVAILPDEVLGMLGVGEQREAR